MSNIWRAKNARIIFPNPAGFVSLKAEKGGGELITKPIEFNGEALSLNFQTQGKGRLRVELQDPGSYRRSRDSKQ